MGVSNNTGCCIEFNTDSELHIYLVVLRDFLFILSSDNPKLSRPKLVNDNIKM